MTAVGGVYPGESDASDTVVTTAMKPPVIRPARPGDAADLARNWIDAARHYAELDSNAFQVPTVAERQLLRDLGRARLYVDALGWRGRTAAAVSAPSCCAPPRHGGGTRAPSARC